VLLAGAEGEVIVREWWNGFSALLDVTNPEAGKWLLSHLDVLRDEYGVDGFKFDAGDLRDYLDGDRPAHGNGPGRNGGLALSTTCEGAFRTLA